MTTLLEGLRDLDGPCATVLSVSGFLAFLRPFLVPGRFILRVRKGPCCLPGPSLLQPNSETGSSTGAGYLQGVCTGCVHGHVHGRVYLQEWGREAYTGEWSSLPGTMVGMPPSLP